MSFQPIPPKLPGKALISLGIVVFLLGVAAGVVWMLSDQSQYDSKVQSLGDDSAALSGCLTDLTFTKKGTFVLYYVYEGRVRVNGSNDGCADKDSVDLSGATKAPDMEVTLTDPDGDTLKLSRPSVSTSKVFSGGGVKAKAYKQVTIKSTGDYQIEINAADDVKRFAIGVGPKLTKPSPLLPIAAGVGGAALGLLMVVIGAVRRGSAKRRLAAAAQQPVAYGTVPQFNPPAQYPAQPPFQPAPPPVHQGYEPTHAMPPIQQSPDGVGWTTPGQPLPPPTPPTTPPSTPQQ